MLNPECNHPCCGKTCKKKTAAKPRQPIRKVSIKRAALNRTYQEINARKLAENPLCAIQAPGICTKYAQGQNHIQKRLPSNLIDEENLENACNACNQWIETAEGQAWAKKNNHWKSRITPAKR